jgi:hypothetical protein
MYYPGYVLLTWIGYFMYKDMFSQEIFISFWKDIWLTIEFIIF